MTIQSSDMSDTDSNVDWLLEGGESFYVVAPSVCAALCYDDDLVPLRGSEDFDNSARGVVRELGRLELSSEVIVVRRASDDKEIAFISRSAWIALTGVR